MPMKFRACGALGPLQFRCVHNAGPRVLHVEVRVDDVYLSSNVAGITLIHRGEHKRRCCQNGFFFNFVVLAGCVRYVGVLTTHIPICLLLRSSSRIVAEGKYVTTSTEPMSWGRYDRFCGLIFIPTWLMPLCLKELAGAGGCPAIVNSTIPNYQKVSDRNIRKWQSRLIRPNYLSLRKRRQTGLESLLPPVPLQTWCH